MRSIVVTIPRAKLAEVEAEEAEVARREAAGETDILYYHSINPDDIVPSPDHTIPDEVDAGRVFTWKTTHLPESCWPPKSTCCPR